MECPKCHQSLEPAAFVPEYQRMAMELSYESQYLAAATLGGMVTNTEQLLVAIAKEAGAEVTVFIEHITYSGNKLRIDYIITRGPENRAAPHG